MPITKVKAPDGKILKVEHPEGASQTDILEFARLSTTQQPTESPEFPAGGSPIIPDAIERGFTKAGYSLDFAAYNLGIKSDEDFAKDTSNFVKKMRSIPMSKRTQAQIDDIYSSKNPAEFVWNLATNPIGVGTMVVENLASVAAAGAAAGGAGLAARKFLTTVPSWIRTGAVGSIFGLQSGTLEASQFFFGDLREQGIDVEDPELVQSILENEEVVANMRRRATKAGIPPAAFDTLTFGIAGLPTRAFTKNFTDLSREAFGKAAVAELGTQGVGGALGAAGSQLLTEGRITDPIDIGLEFALEVITGGPQAAGNLLTTHGIDSPLMSEARDSFSKFYGNTLEKGSKLNIKGRPKAVIDSLLEKHRTRTEGPEEGETISQLLGEGIQEMEVPPPAPEERSLLDGKQPKGLKELDFFDNLTPAAKDYLNSITVPTTAIKGETPQAKASLHSFAGIEGLLEKSGKLTKQDIKNAEKLIGRTNKVSQLRAINKRIKAEKKGLDSKLDDYESALKKLKADKEKTTDIQELEKINERIAEAENQINKIKTPKLKFFENAKDNLMTDFNFEEPKPGMFKKIKKKKEKVEPKKEEPPVTEKKAPEVVPEAKEPKKKKKGKKKEEEKPEVEQAPVEDREIPEEKFYGDIPNQTVEVTGKELTHLGVFGKVQGYRQIKRTVRNVRDVVDEDTGFYLGRIGEIKAFGKEFFVSQVNEGDSWSIYSLIPAKKTPAEKIASGDDKPDGAKIVNEINKAVNPKIEEKEREVERFKTELNNLSKRIKKVAKGEDENIAPGSRRSHELDDQWLEKQEELAKAFTELKELKDDTTQAHKAGVFLSAPLDNFTREFGPYLKATKLTTYFERNNAELLKELRKLIEKLAGPYTRVEFVNELVSLDQATNRKELWQGALWQNQIIIAMNPGQKTIGREIANLEEQLKGATDPKDQRAIRKKLEAVKKAKEDLKEYNPTPTAIHESLHAILEAGLWNNPRVRSLIERDIGAYKDIILKDTTIDPRELDKYLSGAMEESIKDNFTKELFATAGGMIISDWWLQGRITRGAGLPKESRNLLQTLMETIKKIWAAIRKQPYTLEDVFVDLYPAKNSIREMLDSNIRKTHEEVAELKRKAIVDNDIDISMIEEDLDAAVAKNLPDLPYWTRMYSSKAALAEKHPALKWIFNIMKAKERDAHQRSEKYSYLAKDYWKLKSKKQRYALSEIARTMKEKGKGFKIDEATNQVIVYPYLENDNPHLLSPELSTAYLSLQAASKEVLSDFEAIYRMEAHRTYPDLPDGFTAKDVDALLADEEIQDSDKEKLTNIKTSISKFKRLQNIDYAPEMRFGEFGNVVFKRLKEGEVPTNPDEVRELIKGQRFERVDFSTIERYGVKTPKEFIKGQEQKNIYHPEQMARLKKLYESKGYNSSEYVINPTFEKDANGKRKIVGQSIDKLTPFHLTRDSEMAKLNQDFINLDMLISLMGSARLEKGGEAVNKVGEEVAAAGFMLGGLSEEQIQDVKNKLGLTDVQEFKGFKAHFKEGRSVPGSSKDWDRSWRSYFHGAARSGSYLKFKRSVDTVRQQTKKNFAGTHEGLLEDIDRYVEYVNTPAEDWQKMRAANFFWTMGLAPVTALLQYMNLGTTSLAILQQYNPNTLQNLKKVGKWLTLSRHFVNMDNIEWREGSPIVRWDNPDIWEKKIRPELQKKDDKGNLIGMTDEQYKEFKNGFIDAFRSGILGAALVEESATPTLTAELTKTEKFLSKAEKAVQMTGVFIAIAEQQSRITTHAAILDTLISDPVASERAARVLTGEGLTEEQMKSKGYRPSENFDAFSKIHSNLTFNQQVAQFGIDESHAIFGKIARPEIFKGGWGAVPFVFMTWPHQMWETMAKMSKDRGSEGKIALAVLATSFFMIGGMTGFPGGELLRELYEFLYKGLTHEEIDVIERIHTSIGSRFAGEFLTHGALRVLGADMAQRTGLPVPGEKLFLYAVGAVDDPAASLGVLGTTLQAFKSGVEGFRSGAGFWRAAPEMLPVTLSNMVKAIGYTKEGVVTRGDVQLVPQEEVTFADVALRFFGAQSSHISRQREKQWFSQVLNREDKAAYTKYKKRAANELVRAMTADDAGKTKKAAKHWKRYDRAIEDLLNFMEKEGQMQALSDAMNSINEIAFQRITGSIKTKTSKSAKYKTELMRQVKEGD